MTSTMYSRISFSLLAPPAKRYDSSIFLSVGTNSGRGATSTRTGSELCLAIPYPPILSTTKHYTQTNNKESEVHEKKRCFCSCFSSRACVRGLYSLRERSVFCRILAWGVGIPLCQRSVFLCFSGRYFLRRRS